jgi:hypothetical protein
MYQGLGIEPESRVPDRLGRPVPVLDHGEAIAEVLA